MDADAGALAALRIHEERCREREIANAERFTRIEERLGTHGRLLWAIVSISLLIFAKDWRCHC